MSPWPCHWANPGSLRRLRSEPSFLREVCAELGSLDDEILKVGIATAAWKRVRCLEQLLTAALNTSPDLTDIRDWIGQQGNTVIASRLSEIFALSRIDGETQKAFTNFFRETVDTNIQRTWLGAEFVGRHAETIETATTDSAGRAGERPARFFIPLPGNQDPVAVREKIAAALAPLGPVVTQLSASAPRDLVLTLPRRRFSEPEDARFAAAHALKDVLGFAPIEPEVIHSVMPIDRSEGDNGLEFSG